jgi:hypothetical protein
MENAQSLKHIQALLAAFGIGPNRSLQASREIEGAIAESVPSDHHLQELAEDFAQYSPGGGEGLYSEVELLLKVEAFLRRFNERGFFS